MYLFARRKLSYPNVHTVEIRFGGSIFFTFVFETMFRSPKRCLFTLLLLIRAFYSLFPLSTNEVGVVVVPMALAVVDLVRLIGCRDRCWRVKEIRRDDHPQLSGLGSATFTCRVFSRLEKTVVILLSDVKFSWSLTLPGSDYFDEETKCYSRLFEFCQVIFCRSRQWGRVTLAKF